MNLRISFLLLILFVQCFKVAAQELPFVHYTPNNETNPLPSANVTYAYQDKEGYMWMGVYSSGLVRYNGSKMEIFNQKDGLKDLGIWQMLEDNLGHLWVSSNSGLVVSEQPLSSYDSENKIRFTSEVGGIPLIKDAIIHSQIVIGNKGKIWLATEKRGFLRYQIQESGKLEFDSIGTDFNQGKNLAINAVLYLKDGEILAGLEGGILAKFSGNSAEIVYSPRNLINSKDNDFSSLFEDKDGKIWGYKKNGELVFFEHLSQDPTKVSQLEKSDITGLISLDEDVIWAVSQVNGIVRIDQKTKEVLGSYSRKNGLLSDNIFHVLKDREGNVWISQSAGISKLRFNFSAFENFSDQAIAGEDPILPSAKVNTILVTDQNKYPFRFLVGTEGGVSAVSGQGTSQYITKENGLIHNWVNGLAMDSDGRIWMATVDGLSAIVFEKKLVPNYAVNAKNIKIFGTQATIFSVPDSPPIIAAETLEMVGNDNSSSKKSIWFPGLRSLFGFIDGEYFEFNPKNGLPSSLYKSVAFDGDGHIWVGTLDKGIYRSNKKISFESVREGSELFDDPILFEQFWSTENGAPTNHIEKMLWDDGKMWVGTQEGLFALEMESGKILNHLSTPEGLPANNAVSFAKSPISGNFWVGTNQGLAEVDPRSAKVLNKIFRQSGLIDNEVWLYGSVQVANNGLVYFGTARGLSIYHPNLDKPNTVPPLVKFTSIEVLYQAGGRNEVVFEYSALSFANVAGVKYRTRLLGYEEEWSSETNVKRLRYTNLPAFFWAKPYTLEVIAINESGVESTNVLSHTFDIKPIWWLRWWVFLLLLSSFLLAFYTVDRSQKAKLIKKERDNARIREAELHAETADARSMAAEAQANALKADNEKKALEIQKIKELEKAYQELKAAQNQLIQAEKMASMGRLATGIAHEIKNPLNFINNFATLSGELVDELSDAIKSNDLEEIGYVMENLKINTGKIELHGKRADAIVKSMMQHTRIGKSTFEAQDINPLVEKYIDLAYNSKGMQSPGFFTSIKKNLQPNLKNVNIVNQEIGQVLLNLLGNAFDVVWAQYKSHAEGYEPEVTISTFMQKDKILIKISDNGGGIPIDIQEKIFEPFFTTKPTGEGTGLGLSLSYEIVTHGHNGSLYLEKGTQNGATFVIELPIV